MSILNSLVYHPINQAQHVRYFFYILAKKIKYFYGRKKIDNLSMEFLNFINGIVLLINYQTFIYLWTQPVWWSQRDAAVSKIPNSFSEDDNMSLTTPFTFEEFKVAAFSMQAEKCPSPDGFNPGFYQHIWEMCGHEAYQAGCEWPASGTFPPHLNSFNIALIPKGDTQTSMKDWRPSALCNVVYKIMAKVLANRLKLVLDKCISVSQSAFVSGRSNHDNALVPIELIHYMKGNSRGTQEDIALMLDISKAYDRLDWEYLCDVMIQMGFSTRWVKWITLCVETVDYMVLVNGAQVGPFVPGRGLRQGDPLSPYLFIICDEGLSALIQDAERRGVINGMLICRDALSYCTFFLRMIVFSSSGRVNKKQQLRKIFFPHMRPPDKRSIFKNQRYIVAVIHLQTANRT